MRIGIFSGLFLVGCTTAVAPPTASTTPAPTTTPTTSPSTPASACTDSSQCATGALCCPNVKIKASTPTTPFGPRPSTQYICSSDPVHECSGHELCNGSGCRSPWPEPRIPMTPARTYVDECHSSKNCPKDTTCTLFYAQGYAVSSLCMYGLGAEMDPAHTAPACQTDADCKAALPMWKSVLGDEAYAKALDGVRCAALSHDVERRKGCVIPGNPPLP